MLSARQEDDLPAINDAIHDRWFRLYDVFFDEDSQVLSIPFVAERTARRLKKASGDLWEPEGVIEIGSTSSYAVDDEADIGIYDINSLIYDPSSGSVIVSSGFPLKLVARVTELDIVIR